MIEVFTVYTPAYKSNTYILHGKESNHAIVIDPTCLSVPEIINYMDDNKFLLDFIIPTHGHFDHIEGIDLLKEKYQCKVIATHECSVAFQNSKKNYSYYFENKNVTLDLPDIIIDRDNYIFNWNNSEINLIMTPGHSPCSVCISVDKTILFSGDTILMEYSPFSKFPDGDTHALKRSINLLFMRFPPDLMVYPGHGKPFSLVKAVGRFDFIEQVIVDGRQQPLVNENFEI